MKPKNYTAKGALRKKQIPGVVHTFDEYERIRLNELRVLPLLAASCLFTSWLTARLAQGTTLSLVFGTLAGYYSLCIPAVASTRRAHLYAHQYWHATTGGVELTSSRSWPKIIYTAFTVAALFCGLLIEIILPWLTVDRIPETIGGSTLAVVLVLFIAYEWRWHPKRPRKGPVVILTPDGILAWPNEPYSSQIPWTTFPSAKGIANHSLYIVTSKRLQFLVPIAFLAITGTQLARVIEFYTKHINLRYELTTPEGLNHVKLLMHNTVEQVEQTLAPQKHK